MARAPVVALIGARQVGKTTLARKLADRVQGTIYLDLERVGDRRKLDDAEAFLQAQVGHLTVLDEVQRLPALFAELRGIVDDRRARGERSMQFLLLGSASLDLIQQVSETLAGQGNTLNSARLAQGLGVSAPMIGRYIDLLVDLMLVRRLQPWSGNLAKRLVKSPKIYVRDSGLVHALPEIGTLHQLLGHPVVGPSWEGFVLETLIVAVGPDVAPFYYRTADGAEIDLVIEQAGKPKVAIEVKRASAPQAERGFFVACDDLEIENRIVVGAGAEDYSAKGGVKVRTLLSAVSEVREILRSPFAA
ncbi:ATP-binding protein [Rhizobium esperanzae]|uniref:ATP-binding protein n=1 Tax=Rhizobium esperanzae TaxID=1967781 RepID=UPI001FD8B771|nr:ATP-binding protein [Rhizobium esperanzae]